MKKEKVEAKIKFRPASSVLFDIHRLKKELDANPARFDAVKSVFLYNGYHRSFELDNDHVAHVFIPKEFFEHN